MTQAEATDPAPGGGPARGVANAAWPALAVLLMFGGHVWAGANWSLSAPAFTAAAAALLAALIVASPQAREALARTPGLAAVCVAAGAIALLGLVQFAGPPVCGPSPVWGDSGRALNTSDPERTLGAVQRWIGLVAFAGLGAALGGVRAWRGATIALFAACAVAFIAFAVFDHLQALSRPPVPDAPERSRLNAAFVSANAAAAVFLMVAFAAAGVALAERRVDGGAARPGVRRAALLVLVMAVAALLATGSRSAWAAGLAAAIVLAMTAWPHRRLLIGLGGACLAVAAALLAPLALGALGRDPDLLAGLLTRERDWSIGWAAFSARPCLGWGMGAGDMAFLRLAPPLDTSYTLISVTPHNAVLLAGMEGGWPGVALWTGFAAALAAALLRAGRAGRARRPLAWAAAAALGALLVQNMADYSLAVPSVAAMALFLAGFAASAARPTRR